MTPKAFPLKPGSRALSPVQVTGAWWVVGLERHEGLAKGLEASQKDRVRRV